MPRKARFTSPAYAVIAIPDSGLFAKNGSVVTGHNSHSPMETGEMTLFTRIEDARKHAIGREQDYHEGCPNDTHEWNYLIIPVMVSQR